MHCMYVVVELAFTYKTIVALSANSPKQPPNCRLFFLCLSMLNFYWGFALNQKSMWNKWKNYFSQMKGDVGMSHHEKEGEQEDAYTETGSH